MNSEEFHEQINATIMGELAKGSHSHNPFGWDGIPQSVENVMFDVWKEATDATRQNCFGAPFRISGREGADDTELLFEIVMFPGEDGAFYEGKFNLADAILTDAESGGEEGRHVAVAIAQLERTIARLKHEAHERGWPVTTAP